MPPKCQIIFQKNEHLNIKKPGFRGEIQLVQFNFLVYMNLLDKVSQNVTISHEMSPKCHIIFQKNEHLANVIKPGFIGVIHFVKFNFRVYFCEFALQVPQNVTFSHEMSPKFRSFSKNMNTWQTLINLDLWG